ncbi:putative aluminum-activated malate transporter 3 isoform X2 [Carex rostrata]
MVIQIIVVFAHAAEPYIIGASIFLVAVVTSFMKIWPPLVPYEHCFRVTLFTYCLIIISAYRNSNPVFIALTRLYCIAIGASIAVVMNVLVFPIWAGEQLHNELIASFHAVAESLEECVKKYLDANCSGHIEFPQSFTDEPSFQKCRATMNSSARIDFLANSAKWEPPHGRFRLFYPWSQYVKVGSVLRHFAYDVMSLHGCLHSNQGIYCMKLVAEQEIRNAASQATELLCQLANNLSDMKHNPVETTNILKSVHDSLYRLQQSVAYNSILFTTLRNSFSQNLMDYHNMPKTNAYANALLKSEAYIECLRGKGARRLNSWPSIDSQKMDDARKIDPGKILRRTEYSKSMEALSSGMFVSLLIEFIAKLDHLVDTVDELFKMAKLEDHVV